MSDLTPNVRMLHEAVRLGHVDDIEFLVTSGWGLELPDKDNLTPLQTALKSCQYNSAKLLLKLGANPDAATGASELPLIMAIYRRHQDLACLLIESGATIHRRMLREALYEKCDCVLDMMLSKDRTHIDSVDSDGRTLLIECAQKSNVRMMQCLIKHKYDVNIMDRKGYSALHCAVKSNKINEAKLLLKSGANPNIFNRRTKIMVLILAAIAGNGETVRMLLEHGARRDARDKFGRDSVYHAASESNLHVLQVLLHDDFKVEVHPNMTFLRNDDVSRNPNPVFAAIVKSGDNLEIIKLLIDKSGDELIGQRNDLGQTALHVAARAKCVSAIQMLLKRGIDRNITDNNNKTALDIAIEESHFDLLHSIATEDDRQKIENLLIAQLEVGINTNLDGLINFCKIGKRQVKAAIDRDKEYYLEVNDIRKLCPKHRSKKAIFNIASDSKDLNINDCWKDGCTFFFLQSNNRLKNSFLGAVLQNHIINSSTLFDVAMEYAIETEATTVIHRLCDAGLDLQKYWHRCSLISFYCFDMKRILNQPRNIHNSVFFSFPRFLFVFLSLLENDSMDINEVNSSGVSALQSAIRLGLEDVAVVLIQHGANPNLNSYFLDMCRNNLSPRFFQLLIEAGGLPHQGMRTLLQLSRIAIRTNKRFSFGNICYDNDNMDIGNIMLFDYKYDINYSDEDHETALYYAIREKNYFTVSLLIILNADLKMKNKKNQTPLLIATIFSSKEIIELIINKALDTIDVPDEEGNTPLFYATEREDHSIVSLLLNHKADMTIKNKKSQTLLMIAAKVGFVNITDEFISATNINDIDNDGETALYKSVKFGNMFIATRLITKGADIDIPTINGNTPFHVACYDNQTKLVSFLLEHKANPRAKNNANQTPLMCAVNRQNKKLQYNDEVVKWLLALAVDTINDFDVNNMTALDISQSYENNAEVSKLIIEAGGRNNTGSIIRDSSEKIWRLNIGI